MSNVDLGSYKSLIDHSSLVLTNVNHEENQITLELLNIQTYNREIVTISKDCFTGKIEERMIMKISDDVLLCGQINNRVLTIYSINLVENKTSVLYQTPEI